MIKIRILITGSSGMIGTALCKELEKIGIPYNGLDILPNKWDKAVNSKTIIHDLRTEPMLRKEYDIVVHLAANARVWKLVQNPEMARDNMLMTYNILEFCRKKKVPRFILASSREVYGSQDNNRTKEDSVPQHFGESPYTASKIASEALVRAYNQCYGMNYIILRFSNVYGKYDTTDRFIPLMIRLASQKQTMRVFGKDKVLDFTYIDDNIAGILCAILQFDKNLNETFNIASGEGNSLLWVAEAIKSIINPAVPLVTGDNRPGELMFFVADITKAKLKLGYKPTVQLEQGLREAIKWYHQLGNY